MDFEKTHRPERELAEREPKARTGQAAEAAPADNATAPGEARLWSELAAARGTSGSPQQLPHLARIQQSFGRHDVSSVRAHVGGPAASASRELGARAYAHGDSVAFAEAPDLHTAAHEAAHVVQQQSGIARKAIDGGSGDAHEQHADAVADAVVRGRSAEALLDPVAGRGGGAVVQRKTDPSTGGAALTPPTWEYCNTHRVHIIARIADRIRSVGLPKPHPRLYWAIRENAEQAFIDVIAKDIEVMQTQTLHRLMEFSYPADLYTIVDGVRRGGTPSQLREWHDVVGIAIANAMTEPLDASIQRMAMRLRVQLDGPARGDVHNAQLVPSCPLDVLVSEAFKKVGVIGFVGGAEHKSSVDDTPGKPFAHGTNPVQFEYAGKRDPKLWNWIEVTSPKNATAEDVAATQLDKTREDSAMGPQQAYRITASPPYFGIPIEVARRVPAMRDFASAKDEEDASTGNFGRVADARALHDSSVSDEVAVKQAPPAGPHTESLDRLLGRVETQIAAIAERLERVKAVAPIAGAKAFIGRCRDKLTINPKDASRFVPAVAAQESILHEVSSELVEIFRSLDQRKAKSIPPSVADVIRAYARAAGASHLAAEASTLIVEARQQKALLPLAILDDEVRSARDNIGDHGDMTEKGAEEQTAALPGVMTQAADMRLRVSRGEKVTGTEISQATADANELDTRARLTNLANTVRALQTAADSVGLATGKMPGGFWSVSLVTQMILDLIEKPEKSHAQYEGADKLHGGWLEHLNLAKTNGAKPGHDPKTEMQTAVKYVNAELALMDGQLGGMKTFIKWCNEQREYQALKNLLTSMAWQIGLMIVTGEIAGAGLAAVRGIALAGEIAEDVRGASLLWRGAEVVVHAGLQTVANGATGGDISASAFAENALGMLLSSAAMKPFKALLEEDAALERNVEQQLSKLAKTGKFVKAGFKLGADVAVDLSGGVVGAGVAHAIVNNADTGITSRDAWMTQSLALTASAVVHAHTAPLHARLARAVESMRAAKMQELAAQLDALAARAETLETKSSPKRGITPDEAGAMLAERHQILVQEHALYEKAGASDLAKKSAADAVAGGAPVEAQLQLAGISSVVDGIAYEGTGKQIEHALRNLGDEVKASRDAKGVWTVTARDRSVTVKELDFDPKERPAKPQDGKTVTLRGGGNVATSEPASRAHDAPAERPTKELSPSEQLSRETDADGRIALSGDDNLLRDAARRAKPLPGYVDVVAHADAGHFYIVRGLQEIAVTHRTVALAMEKAGLKGQKIRLLACESGRDPMAVAQDLANKTKTEVLAPNMKVWVDETGNVGVGERGKHQGEFVPFKPQREAPVGDRPGPMIEAEHGGQRDPHAPDKDPVLRSEHDHRDRVEQWNHDQLQAQVGKPLVLDPSFKDGVRISVRKTAAGYEVTAVQYGPDARALDVQRHAEIVARIERYNGLVGKVRRWHDALTGKRNGKAYEAGSRGDRLQLELEKLEAHIRDTNLMRSNDAMDAGRAREETQFLEDAVAELREQLDSRDDLHEHDAAFDVNRPAEPIGYVTEKAKEVGYKLPGEAGAKIPGAKLDPADYYYRRHGDLFELARKPGAKGPQVEVVYDSAGGFKGVRVVPEEGQAAAKLGDLKYPKAKELLFSKNHSMDPYAAMLEHLQIADRSAVEKTAERLYKKLTTDGKGEATIDTWRHDIKEEYRREVERRLFDKSLSEAESYRQLRDAVDLLANKDRALLVEGWYKARRLGGKDVTSLESQKPYTIERTEGPNAGHKETRAADFLVGREKIQGKEIVEVKDIEGEIDKEQFSAYVDAIRDDKVRASLGAERMRYVFTKEAGAAANLEFLANAFDKERLVGVMTIEVYAVDGSMKIATDRGEAMRIMKSLRNR